VGSEADLIRRLTLYAAANMAKTSFTSVGNSADSREPLLRRESIEIAA
jgi:hypothetical protein